MTFKIIAVLIGSCLAASGAAAQTLAPAQATLSAPVAQTRLVIANDRPWRCDGQTCSGPSGEGRFDDQHSCRDIAQKVGAVSGFQGTKGAFSADDLARCNKYARSSG